MRAAARRGKIPAVADFEASGREPRSALGRVRVRAQVSQKELAEATGISVTTIRRLERLEFDNPPLRYLVNCALALGVPLDQVIEDEWRQWKVFDIAAAQPPGKEWIGEPSARWSQSPFSAMRQRSRANRGGQA